MVLSRPQGGSTYPSNFNSMFVPGVWPDAVLDVRLGIGRRPGRGSVDEGFDRRFFCSGLQGVDSVIDDTWNASIGVKMADDRSNMSNSGDA